MPNVLLIGGSNKLNQDLGRDPRWNVVRAIKDDDAKPSRNELGDPRRWQLIIDEDQRYERIDTDEAPAIVSGSYLGEAKRAHIVKIVTPKGDGLATTVETEGHYDLEFTPTGEPETGALVDFVDRFKDSFERVHLDIEAIRFFKKMETIAGSRAREANPVRPLFVDFYGNPLIVIGDFKPPVLYLCDLPDDDVRTAALLYIAQKTVPKLWPEAISDLFQLARLGELDREERELIETFRVRKERIEAKRDEEIEFYAPYFPLTELGEKELKELVRTSLRDVFGFDVLDLDEDLVDGEAKNLDLLLRESGLQIVIEVSSSGTRGAKKRDLEDLDDHMARVIEKYGRIDSKVLLYNGFIRRAELKTLEKTFSEDVIREAKAREICLMAPSQLLECIEKLRNGQLEAGRFIRAMTVAGVLNVD